MKNQFAILLFILLAACSSAPKTTAPIASTSKATSPTPANQSVSKLPALPKAGSGRGGYYKDDGPGENPPPNLELILDAEPKVEPYSKTGNKPYVVFGKTYTPMTDDRPFLQRGIGSWYGKKYHGLRTSTGETYDMYKMTAAHPTLPIPSYARITNLNNGRQVIVKINDRGPFHSDRIVDLSYTAAMKLDYLHKGSGELLLERLLPADIEKMAENKSNNVSPTVALNAAVPAAVPVAAIGAMAMSPAPNVPTVSNLITQKPAIAQSLGINELNTMSGFYLQFGAFGLRANAEATFAQLQNQLAQLPTLEIVQQGTLYRLFSGPFASHEEASKAVQLALNAGVPKPVIVQR